MGANIAIEKLVASTTHWIAEWRGNVSLSFKAKFSKGKSGTAQVPSFFDSLGVLSVLGSCFLFVRCRHLTQGTGCCCLPIKWKSFSGRELG